MKNESEIVEEIRKIKLPVQRSPEWHAMRDGKVTASSSADTVPCSKDICESYVKLFNIEVKKKKIHHHDFVYSDIRTCGYNTKNRFILNKVEPQPFVITPTIQWGVSYEEPATRIWERKNKRIIEFGLLPHPTIEWIGASPDGITVNGRMLEIKCPSRRKINGICPLNYYIQVQQQLEVTGLSKCDYEEVLFIEYANEEEYLEDKLELMDNDTIPNQNIVNQIPQMEEKGLFIEAIDNEDINDYRLYRYYYPPKDPETHLEVEMSQEELVEWANKEIIKREAVDTIKQWWKWLKDPEYRFNPWYNYRYTYNIRYWKMVKYSVMTIDRDQEFFKKIKPYLEDAWNKVLYYRKNRDKLHELKSKKKKQTLNINVYNKPTSSKAKVNRMVYSDSDSEEVTIPIKPKSNNVKVKAKVNRMVYSDSDSEEVIIPIKSNKVKDKVNRMVYSDSD